MNLIAAHVAELHDFIVRAANWRSRKTVEIWRRLARGDEDSKDSISRGGPLDQYWCGDESPVAEAILAVASSSQRIYTYIIRATAVGRSRVPIPRIESVRSLN